MSILLGAPNRGGLEIVQDYWRTTGIASEDFETQWNKWLNVGMVRRQRVETGECHPRR